MTPEALALLILIMVVTGFVVRYVAPRVVMGPTGIVRTSPFTDQKLMKAATDAASQVNVSGLSFEKAEERIAEIARHAVAKEYAQLFPGAPVEVSDHWPHVECTWPKGGIATLRVWVGHTVAGGEGLRASTFEVNAKPTLNLTGKPDLKSEYEKIITPPPKEKPAPVKAPAPPVAKPVPGKAKR